MCPLPSRLPSTGPAFPPIGSNFSALVAQTLGSAGTPGDGWDALYNNSITAFDGSIAVFSLLDAELLAMAFNIGDIAGNSFDGVIIDTQPFLDFGDTILPGAPGAPPAPNTGSGAPAPPPITAPTGGGSTGGPPAPLPPPPPPPPIDTGPGPDPNPPGDNPGPPGPPYTVPAYPPEPPPTPDPPPPLPPPVLPPIDPLPPEIPIEPTDPGDFEIPFIDYIGGGGDGSGIDCPECDLDQLEQE